MMDVLADDWETTLHGLVATTNSRALVLSPFITEVALEVFSPLRQHNPNQPLPPRRTLAKSTKPTMKPGREKDYASILNVISRFDRPVGSADLGKYRRGWLEYPPVIHHPASEIGWKMCWPLCVLTATKTRAVATVYSPGPKGDQFRATLSDPVSE